MPGENMQLEDWLDDLCVRFIINLPQEDLSSVSRICFQVEEAQWFYEDFIRPLDPTLPSMTLRTFCLRIFQHCPLLSHFPADVHIQAFEEFLQYKTRVPVRGAILLNHAMDSVLLVRGWKKGASWSFPRGKINKDEDDLDCAVREVYEETGFDVRAAGLVPDAEPAKFIEVTMRDQQIRLYVFRDVPTDTHFEPRTRKEISKIDWYRLTDLPAFRKKGANNHQNNQANQASNATNANKFYMVAPFLVPLKKWVVQQRKNDAARARKEVHLMPEAMPEETATEDETWNQPQPGQAGPNQDALEGATRELQRLLRMQPPTQGIQMPQPSAEQDKGGALLALLQSKTPVPHQHVQTTVEVSNTVQAQYRPAQPQHAQQQHVHHQHAHHPLASQNYPPPAYPGVSSGPWPANQHAHFNPAPGVPHNQHQNVPHHQHQNVPHQHQNVPHHHNIPSQHIPHAPALLHPQPLPPQVQKTGVFDYKTPPPHALQKALRMPQNSHQQAPHPSYPGRQQGRPQGGSLNDHSKSLLSAFKTGPSPSNAQNPVELPTNQPEHLNTFNAPQAPSPQSPAPDIAAAAQPYQQADMNPKCPVPQAHQRRGQGQDPKHRTALLGMFKKGDSTSASPDSTALAAASNASTRGSVGTSPHNLLAKLSFQDQPGSPAGPHRETRGEAPKAAGSSQPLMNLLRQKEPEQHQPAQPAAAQPSHHYATYGSPPPPASLPTPAFHGQEAPAGHKNKLLSLFAKQQQEQEQEPPAEGRAEVSKGKETEAGNGDGRGPISSADRSFLLGYLQSATGGR